MKDTRYHTLAYGRRLLREAMRGADLDLIADCAATLAHVGRRILAAQNAALRREKKLRRCRRQLREWLTAHPNAWSGWPSFNAHDPVEHHRRARRLLNAGCRLELAELVDEADAIIASIRQASRLRYEQRTRPSQWLGP